VPLLNDARGIGKAQHISSYFSNGDILPKGLQVKLDLITRYAPLPFQVGVPAQQGARRVGHRLQVQAFAHQAHQGAVATLIYAKEAVGISPFLHVHLFIQVKLLYAMGRNAQQFFKPKSTIALQQQFYPAFTRR